MTNEYPVRVASIPSGHPYVRHLSAPGDLRVRRLPDPSPAVPDPLPGQWWPPVMLEREWVTGHRTALDLVHLHFGFDSYSPRRLAEWAGVLRELRVPLVLTVHDLVNPHFEIADHHLAQLDALVPAADALITLTEGAAAEIASRWGKRATVVPHPHVVDDAWLDRPRPARTDRAVVVGVHAKSLRANLDPVPVLREICEVLPTLPGVLLQVDVHPDVLDPSSADSRRQAFRGWADEVAGRGDVDLRVHDRFTDDDLAGYLAALDICVLPYRFGTHSGWLEACVDVGTPVLVPSVGHYADQHGHPRYRHPATPGAPPAPPISALLAKAVGDRDFALRRVADRRAQRHRIAEQHFEVYRAVLREMTLKK